MQTVPEYREYFIEYLHQKNFVKEPLNLYEPITYVLNLGGKRLRPILVLITAEIFNSSYTKALDAALAIEVFHNFSLIHDDIMDQAPLRRGKKTVHEKWNVNTGILSGDAMLIYAYSLLENYDGETFKELTKLFSKTAIEVCEGQQYDIDFESKGDVTITQYIKMIEYKTAVLVGASMQMGAIIAQASKDCKSLMYEYGRLLGIAFQLQDDFLDAFGNPSVFGKQIGGDIIENKKTFLYLKAMELTSTDEKNKLIELFSLNLEDSRDKINTVKNIFINSGAKDASRLEIVKYTNKAFSILDQLDISSEKKEVLYQFGNQLINRSV